MSSMAQRWCLLQGAERATPVVAKLSHELQAGLWEEIIERRHSTWPALGDTGQPQDPSTTDIRTELHICFHGTCCFLLLNLVLCRRRLEKYGHLEIQWANAYSRTFVESLWYSDLRTEGERERQVQSDTSEHPEMTKKVRRNRLRRNIL